MSRRGALTAMLCLPFAIGLMACGDDDCSDCSPTASPAPTATPLPPGELPFSCVIANCGPDATCASLGFHTNPESHCYLYNDLYLCCKQSPFG